MEENFYEHVIKLSKDGLVELDIEKGLFVEWSAMTLQFTQMFNRWEIFHLRHFCINITSRLPDYCFTSKQTCRMPPPRAFLTLSARAINALLPTITDPTGQPSPWEFWGHVYEIIFFYFFPENNMYFQ